MVLWCHHLFWEMKEGGCSWVGETMWTFWRKFGGEGLEEAWRREAFWGSAQIPQLRECPPSHPLVKAEKDWTKIILEKQFHNADWYLLKWLGQRKVGVALLYLHIIINGVSWENFQPFRQVRADPGKSRQGIDRSFVLFICSCWPIEWYSRKPLLKISHLLLSITYTTSCCHCYC